MWGDVSMPFLDAPSNFYLGRVYDPVSGQIQSDDVVYYDSRDLTTHGLIVGMTGSGKTGLAISLLEEAVLDGVPVLMIDPKGDLGNMLLMFPDFRAEDFRPWIQEDEARRDNMTVDELAAKKAAQWQKGLADWDITPERMRLLREAADYTIYTPGSESGVPISILASLRAPQGSFDENTEAYRDQISSIVTAILALAGINAQPFQDPRHVLMSNLFEHHWRVGEDMTLEMLIAEVQRPPFDRLGVMSINDFFPEKDRFSLAMSLNAMIASPTFSSWLTGAPLDIGQLLFTREGRPRAAIVSIAHLGERERMFVMTLFLETILNWVRQQAGTNSLRAILYIDEIFGFFPPVANPPSKQPLLSLLKQARAYGLGVLLATQNPVDLDYKGLSNIGTWFIGRLQTDNDRARVIAGLQEAAASSDMDMGEVARLIAGLKGRVFLMRNIHDKGVPTLFHTRWAMSYLAGPFTRQQIGVLMADKKAVSTDGAPLGHTSVLTSQAAAVLHGFSDRPPVLKDVQQFFLPVDIGAREAVHTWEAERSLSGVDPDGAQLVFVPALLAQVTVLYEDRKANVKAYEHYAYLVTDIGTSGYIRWDDYRAAPVDKRRLGAEPRGSALFADVPAALTDARRMKALSADLVDTIYKEHPLRLMHSPSFRIYSMPNEDEAAFRARLHQAAREKRDEAMDKIKDRYDAKLSKLAERRARKERELAASQARAQSQDQRDIADIAMGVLGMLTGGGKRTSLNRIGKAAVRTVSSSPADVQVEKVNKEIAEIDAQMSGLQAQMEAEFEQLENEYDLERVTLAEYAIAPLKKNIELDILALGWLPHWRFEADGAERLMSAYASEERSRA